MALNGVTFRYSDVTGRLRLEITARTKDEAIELAGEVVRGTVKWILVESREG